MVTNSNSTKAWVDTVSDLNQYKPSQEELEQRKLARKSNNKLLAKVTIKTLSIYQVDSAVPMCKMYNMDML